jgi:hypothetical protein
VSDIYQFAASILAAEYGLHRVHLDAYLWTAGRANPAA